MLGQWRAADPAAAASLGAYLGTMVNVAEALETAASWRAQRRNLAAGGEGTLSTLLDQLDALSLLPRRPLDVDDCQASFRLLPPPLQRLAPPLLLTAMEAAHAKFGALRRGAAPAAAGAGGAAGELRLLRERAEALVNFGGISVWRDDHSVGHFASLPTAASQQLASWLADMA